MHRYEYQHSGVAEATLAELSQGNCTSSDVRRLPLAAVALIGLMASSGHAEACVPTEPAKALIRELPGSATAVIDRSESATFAEPWQFTKFYGVAGSTDFIGRLLRMEQTVPPAMNNHQLQATGYVRSAWTELLSDVARWQLLPSGWDGDDAVAPSEAAVEAARKFADALRKHGLPRPEHYVAGDGEISFDWGHDGRSASVSFLDDGSVVAYYQPAKDAPLITPQGSSEDVLNNDAFLEGLRSFA